MTDTAHQPPAIAISHVSKLFRRQKQRTFKEMLPALLGGRPVIDSFWALNDISLTVHRGETIGIIGPNGSGKSTLLKLIAGVSQPTKGSLTVNGRIAPLIELGAGFHPELTGRENVYLNGVIMGMLKSEVEARFKEIVDFAELWEFIDTPVKHYSSGMYFRLAFAVAVHTNPALLLIDEIMAVGDDAFQKKCIKKMHQFKKDGISLVIVSHNMKLIEEFCDTTYLLADHAILASGSANDVIARYQKLETNSSVG